MAPPDKYREIGDGAQDLLWMLYPGRTSGVVRGAVEASATQPAYILMDTESGDFLRLRCASLAGVEVGMAALWSNGGGHHPSIGTLVRILRKSDRLEMANRFMAALREHDAAMRQALSAKFPGCPIRPPEGEVDVAYAQVSAAWLGSVLLADGTEILVIVGLRWDGLLEGDNCVHLSCSMARQRDGAALRLVVDKPDRTLRELQTLTQRIQEDYDARGIAPVYIDGEYLCIELPFAATCEQEALAAALSSADLARRIEEYDVEPLCLQEMFWQDRRQVH